MWTSCTFFYPPFRKMVFVWYLKISDLKICFEEVRLPNWSIYNFSVVLNTYLEAGAYAAMIFVLCFACVPYGERLFFP